MTASTRAVTRDGEAVDLTAVEFDLLDVLLTHAGTVVSLFRLVYQPGLYPR